MFAVPRSDGIWNLLAKTQRTLCCLVCLCCLGVFSSCVFVLASNKFVSLLGRWIILYYSNWLGLNLLLLQTCTWCFGSEIVQSTLTSVCGMEYYKCTHYHCTCSTCFLSCSCCQAYNWNFKAIKNSALVKSYTTLTGKGEAIFELPWYLRHCLSKGINGIDCDTLY